MRDFKRTKHYVEETMSLINDTLSLVERTGRLVRGLNTAFPKDRRLAYYYNNACHLLDMARESLGHPLGLINNAVPETALQFEDEDIEGVPLYSKADVPFPTDDEEQVLRAWTFDEAGEPHEVQ